MTKRLLSLFVSAVLVMLPISGCSKSSSKEMAFVSEIPEVYNLTEEQKIEDFLEYYDTMVTSYPSIQNEKDLLGLDFAGKKDFYIEEIKKAKSDFQFYVTMRAIARQPHSAHSGILFPNKNFLAHWPVNSMYLESIVGLEEQQVKWREYLANKFLELGSLYESMDTSFLSAEYIDGQYLISFADSSDKLSIYDNYTIKSINGDLPLNFVKNHLILEDRKYDFKRDTIYIDSIEFNDKIGEEVKLEMQSPDGKIIKKKFRYSLDTPYRDVKINLTPKKNVEKEDKSDIIYSYADKENNLGYLCIDAMEDGDSAATQLRSCFNDIKNFDNIIVDLRRNSGGSTLFMKEVFYSLFYTDDVEEILKADMPKTLKNETCLSEYDYMESTFNSTLEGNTYHFEEEPSQYSIYSGNSNNKRKKIYYLIGTDTCSSADRFATLVKDKNLGTVIGQNTYGEGANIGRNMLPLKNSRFIYMYNPFLGLNADGTDNSIYGTIPHIYSELSLEDHKKKAEMGKKGIDIYEYANMLSYDTVLNCCIEEIKKNA
ncbi:MAG: S41 family peptidase [Oscillospiraceae bacterium]